MELEDMRCCISLAELRSFTQAAQRHFITSQAFGRRIRKVERELGFAVFLRSTRRVDVTPRGELFVKEARRTVDALASLRHPVDAPIRNLELSIGVLGFGIAKNWQAVLETFRATHPDVTIQTRDLSFSHQSDRVGSGEVDLAIICEAAAPDLATDRLLTLPAVAVVPARSTIAERDSIELHELRGRTFLDMPVLDQVKHLTPYVHRTSYKVERPAAIPIAVATSGAISLHAEPAVDYFPNPDVRYVPVVDYSIDISVVHRKGRANALAEDFVSALRSQVEYPIDWKPTRT